MLAGLISLLVLIIIVGIVAWLLIALINMVPLPAPFGRIATVLVYLIAVLIILARALPMLGVSI